MNQLIGACHMTAKPPHPGDHPDDPSKAHAASTDAHLTHAASLADPHNHLILTAALAASHRPVDLKTAVGAIMHGFSLHDPKASGDHTGKIAAADAAAGRVAAMSDASEADIASLVEHASLGGSILPGQHDLSYAEARVQGTMASGPSQAFGTTGKRTRTAKGRRRCRSTGTDRDERSLISAGSKILAVSPNDKTGDGIEINLRIPDVATPLIHLFGCLHQNCSVQCNRLRSI